MKMTLTYHDDLPKAERKKSVSKYDLLMRKFLLSKERVASTKAPSEKQASTIASGFRRCVKDRAYPVQVVKRGTEIYFVNMKIEKGSESA